VTPYPELLAELTAADPALGGQLAGLANLEAILNWAPTAGIDFAKIDLLQQDEYCYDLYLPLPGGRWLVFGVT
jgi:hypothetical protein